MKIKDFKKQVKVEKIETPDVGEKVVKPYPKGVVDESFFRRPFPIRIAISFTILVLVAVFAIVFIPNDKIDLPKINNSGVNYIKNKEELKELLSYEKKENDGLILFTFDDLLTSSKLVKDDIAYSDMAPTSIDDRYIESNPEREMSSTNNQINGVDEDDIVKCDGNRIYRLTYLNGISCIIINEIENGVIKESKIIQLGSTLNYYSNQMYVTDKYIVVIGEYVEANNNTYYDGNRNYFNTHTFVIAKIFDKLSLELVKEYKGLGQTLNASRIVEGDVDCLYFIYTQAILYKNNEVCMPDCYIDENNEEIACDKIAYFGNIINKAYTYIVSIRLDDELKVEKQVQLGAIGWSDIYCTKNSIYLISQISSYSAKNLLINFNNDEYFTGTSIIKYEIDNGSINPVTGLYTRGVVENQFYIDEYNGYLRLALSEANRNKIEVYELGLNEEGKYEYKLVGAITEGLGELNEKIRSARFNGDECLIVTAKNTDPLYKIDLSNPENPKILGKFKEDGYNSYLQYLTGELEGLAIGLGYNTEDISDYYLIKNGTKIGLYDVTADAPVQIDEINYNAISLEACENHKALFVYKDYIGFFVNDAYKLYKVVNEGEGYKLKELLSYNAEKKYDYDYESCVYGRMYYVDGYFYLANITDENLYKSCVVSFNSEFEMLNKIID